MENENYKVTVGIPVYNSEKYIERCLNSIFNQTYKNIEIIIVNDGSTDRSEEIINSIIIKYKEVYNIKLFTKQNEGPAKTRNFILKQSTGKFIYFIDSDDWIEMNAIERMVSSQIKNDCDIVKFNYFVNYNEEKSIQNKKNKYINKLIDVKNNQKQLIEDILLGNMVAYPWSMLIKKDIIKENLLFIDCHQEDKIFLLRLLSNVKNIYFLPEKLYHYFVNLEGVSHKHKFYYYLEQDIKLYQIIKDTINELYNNDIDLQQTNDTMTAYFIERNIYNIYKTSNYTEFIKVYNETLKEWQKLLQGADYKILKLSNYATEREKYLKIWNKNNIDIILRTYDKEKKKDKKIETIKLIIKKIVRRGYYN